MCVCVFENQLKFIVAVGGMAFSRLLRLLDRRYRGIAHGVGQSEILGRIHVAPIKVIYILFGFRDDDGCVQVCYVQVYNLIGIIFGLLNVAN